MKVSDTLRANALARLEWLGARGWTPQLLALAAGDGVVPTAFVQESASAMLAIDRLALELAIADPSSLLKDDFDPAADPEPGPVADDRLSRWFIQLAPAARTKACEMFRRSGRPLPHAAAALLRSEREREERESLDAAVEAELKREEAATLETRRAAIRERLSRDRA